MVTAKKTRAGTSRSKQSTPAPGSRAGDKTPAVDKAEGNPVQGEGDYASAREFNREETKFVASHDTEALARSAAPDDAMQEAELDAAERTGKARARPDPDAVQPRAEPEPDDEDTGDGERKEDTRDEGDTRHRP